MHKICERRSTVRICTLFRMALVLMAGMVFPTVLAAADRCTATAENWHCFFDTQGTAKVKIANVGNGSIGFILKEYRGECGGPGYPSATVHKRLETKEEMIYTLRPVVPDNPKMQCRDLFVLYCLIGGKQVPCAHHLLFTIVP